MKQLNKAMWNKRKNYPEKVIQFGTGNFLRGFADWMIHQMNERTNFNGSVVIVQSTEQGAAEIINKQNGLYTVLLQGTLEEKPFQHFEIIESVSRAINVHRDYDQYLSLAKSPDLRFVLSNTTEAGIQFREQDQLSSKPQQTFPGKLTAFLYERFQHFKGDLSKGLVMIPCELIDQNGEALKKAIEQYAAHWSLGAEFSGWLQEANTFCSSLVDRIVPGYPHKDMEDIQGKLGYEDRLFVSGEYYHFWAIQGPDWLENEFPAQKAGLHVQVVDNLDPYRLRKVFILNGAHTALAPVAYFTGNKTVRGTMENRETKEFVEKLVFDEIIPAIDLPEQELAAFADDVFKRFCNPFMDHYVQSIALNAVPKFKTRNLPVLVRYIEKFGEAPAKMIFSFAALIHFYKQHDKDEKHIITFFRDQWALYDGATATLETMVKNILAHEKLWGQNANHIPGLTKALTNAVMDIERSGFTAALKKAGEKSERYADFK